jgi:hydroxypyruvate isomerase
MLRRARETTPVWSKRRLEQRRVIGSAAIYIAAPVRVTLQGMPGGRRMPRFAANLAYLFTERPPIERFGAAAAAGFAAVELQFPYVLAPSAVKAELHRHDLIQLGINSAVGRPGESGLAAMPGRERDWETVFRQALDYVVAIGGSAIHCMAGIVAPEQRPAAESVFVKNLAHAAAEAAKANITLLIEPINPRDRKDYFLSHVEHAAEIVKKVGADNVRIQFDFYHIQIVGGDLIKRFEKLLPWIGHVQIAAVPSRHEPDEGEINYPAVFEAIDRAGYQGWIGCEYRPRGTTVEGLGWAKPYGVVAKA